MHLQWKLLFPLKLIPRKFHINVHFSFYYAILFCLFFLRSIRNYSCLLTSGQSVPRFLGNSTTEYCDFLFYILVFLKNKNTIVSWWNNSKKLITSFEGIISYLWRHLTKYALGGWINLIRAIGFKSETCLLHNREMIWSRSWLLFQIGITVLRRGIAVHEKENCQKISLRFKLLFPLSGIFRFLSF